jgi:hypothetical protein
MPRSPAAPEIEELTPEERRERRQLRREKQRENNTARAAKMHRTRLKMANEGLKSATTLKKTVFVGCSGWRYWKWRDSFYAEVPQPDWFKHYASAFDTVEINASFRHNYSDDELLKWASRIKESGARRAWIYFNNDYDAHAPRNAKTLHRMLSSPRPKSARPA